MSLVASCISNGLFDDWTKRTNEGSESHLLKTKLTNVINPEASYGVQLVSNAKVTTNPFEEDEASTNPFEELSTNPFGEVDS